MWSYNKQSQKMSSLKHGMLTALVITLVCITGTRAQYAANCAADTCATDECWCGDLPVTSNPPDSYAPDQNCYASNIQINFACGGTLSGPPYNTCGSGTGIWGIPSGPTCISGSCSKPVVDNGIITPDQADYDIYDTIAYSCADGYTLVGPSSASCESGSVWSPSTIPTCEAGCDAPTLENGYVVPDVLTFDNGQVVDYECNENYTRVGVSKATCRDGVYDPDSLPTCYGMCNPPVVPNSNYDTSQPLVDHSVTITVTCDPGFSTGTGTQYDMTCTDGAFDDLPPTCYANCPVLSLIDNGDQTGDTSPYYHGETVSYTCNTGYTLVGSSQIYCADGLWNDTVPECKADCNVGAVGNSDYAAGGTVIHGTVFDITCDTGYSTGTAQATEMTCTDGVLSPALPTCYADCTPPIVPNSDYSMQQPDVYSSEDITVTCSDGYSIDANSQSVTLTCNNGDYGTDPVCYANCPEIVAPTNGIIVSGDSPYFHSEDVTFQCNTNYTLEGSATITCTNGLWSDDAPTCAGDCLVPDVANSSPDTPDQQVPAGTVVIITCDSGYSTGTGTTQMITCDDGSFDPEAIPCLENCIPPVVPNSDYAAPEDPVMDSQTFAVTCNANFTLGYGSSQATTTLTCSDGNIVEETPVCSANCPDPGKPENGNYNSDTGGLYHGTTVTYYCNTNFDLNGNSTRKCNNGAWSGVMPNCTDMSDFDRIMLTCGPTSMEVEIPTALIEGIGPGDIAMEGDLSCTGYEDGDMMRVNTTLSGCGTNKTENATHDIYENRVVNNYMSEIITRVVDIEIPLTCIYDRSQQVRAVRYTIDDYIIGKTLVDTGTYDMTFKIYNDSQYTNDFADGAAVNININTELYFKLELVTDVNDNQLVPQNCWATPTEDSGGDTSHFLLQDRCVVDETMIVDTDGGPVYEFRLESFRFVDDDDKQVYVHCTVYVCHTASTDSFCQPCVAARRKRDIEDVMAIEADDDQADDRQKRASMHDPIVKLVKAGPITWATEDEMEEIDVHAQANVDIPEPDSTSSWMYSVVGLGVVTVVFSVILIAVVKHYKERLQKGYKYRQLSEDS